MKFIRTIICLICFLLVPLQFALANHLRVEIRGVSSAISDNIKERLLVEQHIDENQLTNNDINIFYHEAPDHIKKAMQPFGYFKPKINSQLKSSGDTWIASFVIDPGKPSIISEENLMIVGPGKNNSEIQKFVDHFPVQTGQIFEAERYENAKQELLQTASLQGYLKAQFVRKEIRISLKQNSVKIFLILDTGPQYYFGPVTFDQHCFSERFLKRFLNFHPGEPFSSQKLLLLQQNMSSSRFFQQVDVNPDSDLSQTTIPTTIVVQPRKAKQYSLGLGYGTYTGPRLTLGTEFRHLNAMGHQFNAKVRISSVITGINAKYSIPGQNPLTDQYDFGINVQLFMPKNGKSFSETLSTSYIKNIWGWENTVSLNYLKDKFTVYGQSSQDSYLLYPEYNLSHTSTDNVLSPTKGYAINFNIHGATQKVFSTENFIQGELRAKILYSPTLNSHLILRGDIGYTVVKELQTLPLTMRFFAGGIDSIRGYPFKTIGPGRYLKTAGIEFQHRIVGDWFGAVFCDVGNAANHFNAPWLRGDGIGIIYQSMIGPVKVYVARAESLPKKPYRLELNIGPEL